MAERYFKRSRLYCESASLRVASCESHDDDDDKLYLTTLTLSAEAGFHNGRVKNINTLLQVK